MRNISVWFANLIRHAPIKIVASTVLGWLIYLVGADNWSSLGALAILCSVDFGIAMYICAKKGKRVYSKRLADKLGHFIMYTVGVITMHMLNIISGKFSMFTDIAIGWFGFTEAWSIAEHMASMGYRIPLSVLRHIDKD